MPASAWRPIVTAIAPLAIALPVISSPLTATDDMEPLGELRSVRTYLTIGRPALIEVVIPEEMPPPVLAVLDHAGERLRPLIMVAPGVIDLAAEIENFWSISQTCYLQLVGLDGPIGSALVLQPLLEPAIPILETTSDDAGRVTWRIIGWSEEVRVAGRDGSLHANNDEEGEEAAEVEPSTGRFHSGYRVYPERDVLMQTTHGPLRIALRPDHAPNTVWNFRSLVFDGFYDGLTFHRIIPLRRDGYPFIIQAGDPHAGVSGFFDATDAAGAPGTAGGPGYRIPLERSGLAHDFGVVSMARGEHPDSAGSQFFIALSRQGTAHLDGQYAAFGEVIEGAPTILTIAEQELDDIALGRPVYPPLIHSALLVPAPPRYPGHGRPDRRVMPTVVPFTDQPPEAESTPAHQPPRVPR